MTQQQIPQTYAAAVTPLGEGGESLDEDAFAPLLDFYGASGIDGVLVLGTTGEGILLDPGERRRATDLAIAAAQTLRVIVHCGAQNTADTSALATYAAQAGADGVAVIAPPYYPLHADEIIEHFAAAAAACDPLPFYVYEFADRSGYSVPPAVVNKLRERAPNLAGMKVSDKPFATVEPYLNLGLDVFIGAESLLAAGLASGAAGAVSGVAGAFPELVLAHVREPTAEREQLIGSLREAFSRHTLQASVKAALGLRGVPVRGDVRAPLRPLNTEALHGLRSELERLLGADALARPVRA
jgi:dihydrodipicolinate synthase/N-acetylneuraminate lyase